MIEGELVLPQEMKAMATLPSQGNDDGSSHGDHTDARSQVAGALITPIRQVLDVLETHMDQMAAAEGSGS